jgi:hypothetical protein
VLQIIPAMSYLLLPPLKVLVPLYSKWLSVPHHGLR